MNYEEEVKFVYKNIEEALSLKTGGKYLDAILLLARLAPEIRDKGLKSETIAFRGDIYKEMGDNEAAINDYFYALNLLEADNYPKYILELQIGIHYEKEGNTAEALSWYNKALSTGIKANISGAFALSRLIKLKGEYNLTQEERALCADVIKISWTVLNMPGNPDLTNLTQTTKLLQKAESKKA